MDAGEDDLVDEGPRPAAASPVAVDTPPHAAEPPIEIDPTPMSPHGVRVMSRRAFSQGDAIWPVSGGSTIRSHRSIQVGTTTHVEDVGGLAYLNHSCQPNTVVDTSGLPMVFALRDIAPGEELTFFYPSTEWDLVRPFVCWCGAPECVRIVAGARYLPIDVLSRYFINAHIRQLVAAAIACPWHPSAPRRRGEAAPRRAGTDVGSGRPDPVLHREGSSAG